MKRLLIIMTVGCWLLSPELVEGLCAKGQNTVEASDYELRNPIVTPMDASTEIPAGVPTASSPYAADMPIWIARFV